MAPLRFLTPSVLFVAAIILPGCKPASSSAPRGGAPIPVELGEVVRQSIPISYSAIGRVQPLRTVAIKSQVDGVVEKIHVAEGQEVTAGELLVTLDRRPFANSVAMAKAELANARAEEERARTEADRYRRLARVSAISEEQENQLATAATTALATLQVKQAALANAELMLGYTEIRAPFAGRIGEHGLHEGALVKANDNNATLVTLHQMSPMAVAFSVPDRLQLAVQGAVQAGDVRVRAGLRQDPKQTFEGHLIFIDNAIDPTTGTLALKAEFPNEQKLLWPMSYVEVSLFLGEEKDAVLVPEAAVQAGQNGSQIFVVKEDQTVELRPVTAGRRWQGLLQITQGATPGEKVVTDGQLRLTPGAKVISKSATPAKS